MHMKIENEQFSLPYMNDILNIPFRSAVQAQELQSDNHRKSERRKTVTFN